MRQRQFLDVLSEADARARWEAATAHLAPEREEVPLSEALGRILAEDVRAPVDVPGFDRSDVDGFAVRAPDTFGASEDAPVRLTCLPGARAAGPVASDRRALEVPEGGALAIATGACLPRGASAVVMVEHTEPDGTGALIVRRPVAPGQHVTFAGADMGRGEVVLFRGTRLRSQETGVLAALGLPRAPVVRRPRVLVLSTGDEVRPPGASLEVGELFDANGRLVADAAREAGAEVIEGGILPDRLEEVEGALRRALTGAAAADLVVLSGGTSKGAGDLNYRAVERVAAERPGSPGIVVHGVALKPGKPLCLAVVDGRAVVILPGFPASALFTFREFALPLVYRLGGRSAPRAATRPATLPLRVRSALGRTQYMLVSVLDGPRGPVAYPVGGGSGSVRAFARADGFIRIPDTEEYMEEGSEVSVKALADDVGAADLVVIGSHCIGLDLLLARIAAKGFSVRAVPVGSQGGLDALARGEGDVAGVHLYDPETELWNLRFVPPGVGLLRAYGRRQGIAFRPDDERLAGRDLEGLLLAVREPGLRMVNRNRGSGTRMLIDRMLEDATPEGHEVCVRSHHAVAAAIAQGRADWGVTLDRIAAQSGLGFAFITEERFDLAIREERWGAPAVRALREELESEDARAALREAGMVL